MICPYCASDIDFLHFRRRFKCSVCNRGLVSKGVSDYATVPEILISAVVLSILPIPESGVFSWLVPVLYVLMVFFLVDIIGSRVEPDE